MPITLITRNAICDGLKKSGTDWSGRLSVPEFLSRLYNLENLPSQDRRYQTAAGDIACHTVTWPGDWESLWIFTTRYSAKLLMSNTKHLGGGPAR
jgi:hypothetical protein